MDGGPKVTPEERALLIYLTVCAAVAVGWWLAMAVLVVRAFA